MLAHGNHGQLLHIEINCHGDQIRITLAFHDLFGGDGLALQEVNGCRLLAQDQLGAFCLPPWFCSSVVKIAVVAGGVVDPYPLRTRIDFEADKTLSQVPFIQIQRVGSRVKSRVIGSRWDARFPFLFEIRPR